MAKKTANKSKPASMKAPTAKVGQRVLAHLNLNGVPRSLIGKVAEVVKGEGVTIAFDYPGVPKLVRAIQPVAMIQFPGESEKRKVGWEPEPVEEEPAAKGDDDNGSSSSEGGGEGGDENTGTGADGSSGEGESNAGDGEGGEGGSTDPNASSDD